MHIRAWCSTTRVTGVTTEAPDPRCRHPETADAFRTGRSAHPRSGHRRHADQRRRGLTPRCAIWCATSGPSARSPPTACSSAAQASCESHSSERIPRRCCSDREKEQRDRGSPLLSARATTPPARPPPARGSRLATNAAAHCVGRTLLLQHRAAGVGPSLSLGRGTTLAASRVPRLPLGRDCESALAGPLARGGRPCKHDVCGESFGRQAAATAKR